MFDVKDRVIVTVPDLETLGSAVISTPAGGVMVTVLPETVAE